MKKFNLVVPGYGEVIVFGDGASEEIKKNGTVLVDPAAVAEGMISLSQLDALIDKLRDVRRVIASDRVPEDKKYVYFYIRGKKPT